MVEQFRKSGMNDRADEIFTVSVLVKAAVIVLLPHVFVITRMERKSIQTKLLLRQLKLRGLVWKGVFAWIHSWLLRANSYSNGACESQGFESRAS